MPKRRSLAAFSTVMAALLLIASACNDEAPPTRSPNAPTSAPSIRELLEGSATPTSEPVAAAGGANFSPLHRVTSFSYRMNFDFSSDGMPGGDFTGSLNMDGAYVAPDRFSATMTYDFPPIEGMGSIPDMEMVGIGKDFYLKFGGDWKKDDLEALGIESLSPAQDEFYASFAPRSLDGLAFDREDKNGLDTRHYVLGTADIGRLLSEQTSGLDAYFTLKALQDATMELWIAEDGGYAVAMVFEARINPAELAGAFGQQARDGADFDMNMRMTFELSDFNDPDITVDAPEI